jgi:hypothetical protein
MHATVPPQHAAITVHQDCLILQPNPGMATHTKAGTDAWQELLEMCSTAAMVGGPLIKLAICFFAPNIIFRVGSALPCEREGMQQRY